MSGHSNFRITRDNEIYWRSIISQQVARIARELNSLLPAPGFHMTSKPANDQDKMHRLHSVSPVMPRGHKPQWLVSFDSSAVLYYPANIHNKTDRLILPITVTLGGQEQPKRYANYPLSFDGETDMWETAQITERSIPVPYEDKQAPTLEIYLRGTLLAGASTINRRPVIDLPERTGSGKVISGRYTMRTI